MLAISKFHFLHGIFSLLTDFSCSCLYVVVYSLENKVHVLLTPIKTCHSNQLGQIPGILMLNIFFTNHLCCDYLDNNALI